MEVAARQLWVEAALAPGVMSSPQRDGRCLPTGLASSPNGGFRFPQQGLGFPQRENGFSLRPRRRRFDHGGTDPRDALISGQFRGFVMVEVCRGIW